MWPLHRPDDPQPPDAPDADRAAASVPTPPVDDERIAELLDGIAQLRLFAATDLSLAAGAAEAGAFDIASDVLGAGHEELSSFEARILARLHDEPVPAGESAESAAPSRGVLQRMLSSRALPAAPVLAAAAAAVAVAMGVVNVPGSSTNTPSTIRTHAVAASWDYFHQVATSDASADAVIAAGQRLHASLVSLIDSSQTDPAKGQQALAMLAQERALLLRDSPPGAQVVLAQAESLLLQIQQKLPPILALPTARPQPHRDVKASQPQASPSAGASAAPAAQPQPTPASSTSPRPSPSPSTQPAAPSASPQPTPDTSPPDQWKPLQPPPNFGG